MKYSQANQQQWEKQREPENSVMTTGTFIPSGDNVATMSNKITSQSSTSEPTESDSPETTMASQLVTKESSPAESAKTTIFNGVTTQISSTVGETNLSEEIETTLGSQTTIRASVSNRMRKQQWPAFQQEQIKRMKQIKQPCQLE